MITIMLKKDEAILTVGALEPMGSAGILADRSALETMGFHPLTAVADIVLGPEDVEAIPSTLLHRQLDSLVAKFNIDAVKIGMINTRENIETVATFFEDNRYHAKHLVVDTILESLDEMSLLSSSAISLLKMRILPLAEVTISYLSEAERLAGQPVKNISQMQEAAQAISIFGTKNVLIRSNHKVDNEWVDILYDGKKCHLLFNKNVPKVDLKRLRDIFSSILSAYLAKGVSINEAIIKAREEETRFESLTICPR